MKNRYYPKIGFIVFIGVLILSAVTICTAEEITLTTYYPSPYGVYSEMRLFPKPASTTPCATGNPNSQAGVMFYDSVNRTLMVCVETSPGIYARQRLGGGFWTQAGSSLYPNDNSWNVGIGTISPQAKVDIGGFSNGRKLLLGQSPGGDAGFVVSDNNILSGKFGGAFVAQPVNGNRFVLASYRGNPISFWTTADSTGAGFQERLTILGSGLNAGFVGIGTTNPLETLHVNGDIYAGGNFFKSGNLVVVNTAIAAWGAEGGVIAGFNNGRSVAIGQTGAGAYTGLGIASGPSLLASFYAGNEVGIGTYLSGPPLIRMWAEQAPGFAGADIMVQKSGNIIMRTQQQNRLFINSAGNVGIGTMNPLVKLHVDGGLGCRFPGVGPWGGDLFHVAQEGNRPVARIRDDNGAENPVLQFAKGTSWMNLEYTGSTLNIGGNTGSNVSAYDYWIGASGSWASSFSDIRLKENIQPITGVLDKLRAIKCVSFNWNEAYAALGHPNDKRQIGVIAQDVEQSFPELVISSEEGGYKSVNYDGVAAVLLEAIKEQQKQIEELKAKVDALKVKIQ